MRQAALGSANARRSRFMSTRKKAIGGAAGLLAWYIARFGPAASTYRYRWRVRIVLDGPLADLGHLPVPETPRRRPAQSVISRHQRSYGGSPIGKTLQLRRRPAAHCRLVNPGTQTRVNSTSNSSPDECPSVSLSPEMTRSRNSKATFGPSRQHSIPGRSDAQLGTVGGRVHCRDRRAGRFWAALP